MKWVDIKAIPRRIKLLITRRFEWEYVDGEGRHQLQPAKESWKATWAMVGIHTWSWWWVRRWGEMDCGCTRNPLTRRVILYDFKCEVHCGGFAPRIREQEQEEGKWEQSESEPTQ